MYNNFHVWFSQKTGKSYAKDIHCTHMDCGLLGHQAPFQVPPIALAIFPDTVNDPAGLDDVGILHQVSANADVNGVLEYIVSVNQYKSCTEELVVVC